MLIVDFNKDFLGNEFAQLNTGKRLMLISPDPAIHGALHDQLRQTRPGQVHPVTVEHPLENRLGNGKINELLARGARTSSKLAFALASGNENAPTIHCVVFTSMQQLPEHNNTINFKDFPHDIEGLLKTPPEPIADTTLINTVSPWAIFNFDYPQRTGAGGETIRSIAELHSDDFVTVSTTTPNHGLEAVLREQSIPLDRSTDELLAYTLRRAISGRFEPAIFHGKMGAVLANATFCRDNPNHSPLNFWYSPEPGLLAAREKILRSGQQCLSRHLYDVLFKEDKQKAYPVDESKALLVPQAFSYG